MPDPQTLQLLAEVHDLLIAYFYAEDDALARLIADFKRQSKH